MSRRSHKLFLAAQQSLGHSSYMLDYTLYKLTITIEDCTPLQVPKDPKDPKDHRKKRRR